MCFSIFLLGVVYKEETEVISELGTCTWSMRWSDTGRILRLVKTRSRSKILHTNIRTVSAMQCLPRLTVGQLSRLLRDRILTSEQLATYCYTLAVAGESLWKLNAFARLVDRDEVLNQALLSDQRRRDGLSLSPLDGIPVSIKANIAVASQPLTAGSKILGAALSNTPPVGYSADVSECLLKDCGAVLIGLTAQDEFGMGSLGTNTVLLRKGDDRQEAPYSSATKNPLWLLQKIGGVHLQNDKGVVRHVQLPADAILEAHDMVVADEEPPHMSAGGSSCGSAVSVAHGSSLVSLGSDTGGSVRLPAAWCGITGLKPSYGLLSRDGLVSYASSLDTIGILAGSVHCTAVTLEHLAKKVTHRDSTRTKFFQQSAPSYSAIDDFDEQELPLAGLTVGVPAAFSVTEAPVAIRDAWLRGAQFLEKRGAKVETVAVNRLSHEVLRKSLSAYYVLAAAEASSNLARYDGFRYGVVSDPLDSSERQDTDDLSVLEEQYAATRTHGFGGEVLRRVLCGTSVLSSDRFHTFYEAAARLRAIMTKQMEATLDDCDLLLVPTAVFPPQAITSHIDQTEMFANDVMTVPLSMAGLPAIAVPFGTWNDGSLSPAATSLQLVASRQNEKLLIRAAAELEAGNRQKTS